MRKSFEWITYQLLIRVAKPIAVTVGKLGRIHFPAGHYVYTGSAKTHISARVDRHLKSVKKARWHIDYLLLNAEVSVLQVRFSNQPECGLNRATGGQILVPKFGATDCRRGCVSHLKYAGPAPLECGSDWISVTAHQDFVASGAVRDE